MATITPFLKNQPAKDGRCRLYIRLNEGEKRSYLPTEIKILPSQWDEKKHLIKTNHPHYIFLNREIKSKVLELETQKATGEIVSASQITFRAYVEKLVKDWKKVKKDSTLGQFESEINKVEVFRPEIKMNQITAVFLQEYQDYMLHKLGNATNTVWKTMKTMRTVSKEAVKNGIINKNAFDVYKAPSAKPGKRVFLTDDELRALEEYLNIDDRKAVQLTGWFFLLSCYTGFRFQDLENFNYKKYVQGGRLTLYTGKTGEHVSIKIGANLTRVLAKVKELPRLYVNQEANDNIKAIATCAGIEKHLSFHCGRHTFAVRCAAAGLSMEVTGRLLGHTSLKTTAIYYKLADKRIDDEVDKLG